jgi:hypothetical protein
LNTCKGKLTYHWHLQEEQPSGRRSPRSDQNNTNTHTARKKIFAGAPQPLSDIFLNFCLKLKNKKSVRVDIAKLNPPEWEKVK